MGSADAGKSTLLGVLTQGQLDNGRGKARLNMFRHLHEVQSGRTSSISHEILGFDSKVSFLEISSSFYRGPSMSGTRIISWGGILVPRGQPPPRFALAIAPCPGD